MSPVSCSTFKFPSENNNLQTNTKKWPQLTGPVCYTFLLQLEELEAQRLYFTTRMFRVRVWTNRVFLWGVCMFSSCLCRFTLSSPVSPNTKNMYNTILSGSRNPVKKIFWISVGLPLLNFSKINMFKYWHNWTILLTLSRGAQFKTNTKM